MFKAEETSLTRSILAKCEEKQKQAEAKLKEAKAALQKRQAKEMKAVEKKTAVDNKVAKWQKDQQH